MLAESRLRDATLHCGLHWSGIMARHGATDEGVVSHTLWVSGIVQQGLEDLGREN